jgi:hypothetical protein
MRIVLVVCVSGCVAPPLGLGPAGGGQGLATSVGVGVAPGREIVQVEAASSHRFSETFALEYGGAVTQLGAQQTGGMLVGVGALPYARPRWTFGRVSVALAVSGGIASGGEDGSAGAFADAQLAYTTSRWSLYTGAYGLGYFSTIGPVTAATQARVGGELWLPATDGRIGVALELFTGTDLLQALDQMSAATSRYAGAAVKLKWSR